MHFGYIHPPTSSNSSQIYPPFPNQLCIPPSYTYVCMTRQLQFMLLYTFGCVVNLLWATTLKCWFLLSLWLAIAKSFIGRDGTSRLPPLFILGLCLTWADLVHAVTTAVSLGINDMGVTILWLNLNPIPQVETHSRPHYLGPRICSEIGQELKETTCY